MLKLYFWVYFYKLIFVCSSFYFIAYFFQDDNSGSEDGTATDTNAFTSQSHVYQRDHIPLDSGKIKFTKFGLCYVPSETLPTGPPQNLPAGSKLVFASNCQRLELEQNKSSKYHLLVSWYLLSLCTSNYIV